MIMVNYALYQQASTIFNICYIFQMIIHTIHYFTKYRCIY